MWDWTPLRDWLSSQITPYWSFPLLTVVQALMVMIAIILTMAVNNGKLQYGVIWLESQSRNGVQSHMIRSRSGSCAPSLVFCNGSEPRTSVSL